MWGYWWVQSALFFKSQGARVAVQYQSVLNLHPQMAVFCSPIHGQGILLPIKAHIKSALLQRAHGSTGNKFFTMRMTEHWHRLLRRLLSLHPCILENNLKSSRQVPWQSALGGPAWAEKIGQDNPKRSLPTSAVLWFCGSVTLEKKKKYFYLFLFPSNWNLEMCGCVCGSGMSASLFAGF